MPEVGIPLLAVVGVAVVVGAPLEIAFGAVLACWLLVPGNLAVVGLPHIVLVDRVVLYAFAFRLLARRGRPGEPAGSAYRLTAVHAALAAVLVVGYVDGVIVATRSASLASNLDSWFYTLDIVVLFVAALAVMRTVGARRAAGAITVLVSVVAVIGIVERVTGSGWSHFFFRHVPLTYLAAGSGPLQTRAGHVRSQAAAQFALEYGWVLAMLVSVVTVVAFAWAQKRSRYAKVAYVLPVLVLLSIALSSSRSAELAVALAGVLLVVVAGAPRRLTVAVVAAAAVVLLVALVDPSLIGSSFSAAARTNSASVRAQRLPQVFGLVVGRPFTGRGYSALVSTAPGLDDAYALLYVTVGVLGLTAWGALLTTAGASALRTLRAARRTFGRELGSAALVGIVVAVLAGAAYDAVSTPQSHWALVILAALALATAEALPATQRAPRRWSLRALVPLAGVGLGGVLLAAAPFSSSEVFAAFAVNPRVLANASEPPNGYATTVLVNTLCSYLDSPDRVAPGTSINCQQLAVVDKEAWPAEAIVRIEAPTPAALRSEYQRSLAGLSPYVLPDIAPVGTVATGKPAWATTAPLWLGTAGLVAVLLVPPLRRRRRDVTAEDPRDRTSPLVR